MALLRTPFRNISIKWKLSFALIASGLTLIAAYVILAKQIFESDKISYVFDSQSARLESSTKEIESQFQRLLLGARTAVATYNPDIGRLSKMGQQLLDEEKAVLAVELWNETKSQFVFRYSKENVVLPSTLRGSEVMELNKPNLEILDSTTQLLSLRYQEEDLFQIRIAFLIKELVPPVRPSQTLVLAFNNKALEIRDDRHFEDALFENLVQNEKSTAPKTRIWTFNNTRFLISEAPLVYPGLYAYEITPESEALGALGTLFNRSIVFLFLSTFTLIFVSLSLARGLTTGLRKLTEAAQTIGSGNFDTKISMDSEDEMGILARAFSKMTEEIKRLLFETKEKTRMEQELRTASYVQEKLFPTEKNISINTIEINGTVVTSSECGGDWWYYFSQGDDLYIAIADATGHGTPAALITATARSIFSRLEKETLTLTEMLKSWDHAVRSCSQGTIMMTGILIKINTQTGKGKFVNAAHEAPFVFRSSEPNQFSFESFFSNPSTRIGDQINSVEEVDFFLAANEFLVLYTDGIFSVERKDNKTLNEKRLGTKLAKRASEMNSAESMTLSILEEFNTFRGDLPLPDDVSVVTIRRSSDLHNQK